MVLSERHEAPKGESDLVSEFQAAVIAARETVRPLLLGIAMLGEAARFREAHDEVERLADELRNGLTASSPADLLDGLPRFALVIQPAEGLDGSHVTLTEVVRVADVMDRLAEVASAPTSQASSSPTFGVSQNNVAPADFDPTRKG